MDQMEPMNVRLTDRDILIKGMDFELTFNRINGKFTSYKYEGVELIESSPRMNFWRAPIDNDMYTVKHWREKGLDLVLENIKDVKVKNFENYVDIEVKALLGPANGTWTVDLSYNYLVCGDGQVDISVKGSPKGDLPETFPRIGMNMEIPEIFNRVTWYGKGPGETYVDSQEASYIDIFKARVEDLYMPYVYPQENGNRLDVKWFYLTDERGLGFKLEAEKTLNFSAHYYTIEDLEKAKHLKDLVKRDFISLNIDYKQNGLGSNSCGPKALEKHELKPEDFEFKLRFLPIYTDY